MREREAGGSGRNNKWRWKNNSGVEGGEWDNNLLLRQRNYKVILMVQRAEN